jgi:iron complex transport system permease protein
MTTQAMPRRLTRPAGDRRHIASRLLAAAAVLLAVAAIVSLSVGPTGITLASLPHVLGSWLGAQGDATSAREQLVLIDIRLPRTLLAMFVGASLGVAGALMQGMFRNPLADPGIIGVSAGAALFAVATIALGHGALAPLLQPLGFYALPVSAFLGSLLATGFLVVLSGRRRRLTTGTLLLAGIAIAALASSLTGLIAFASDDRELRDLTLWTLGSLGGASWPKVMAVAPFAVLVALSAQRLARPLNGLLLGEAEAFHLGIDVERTKRIVVLATAASVGAAVAVSGIIAFAGIIVPHIVRMIAGPDHRVVLPGSALLGAALMLVADVVARMIVRPAELPVGIVVAAIGAPVFLHLVLRRGGVGME